MSFSLKIYCYIFYSILLLLFFSCSNPSNELVTIDNLIRINADSAVKSLRKIKYSELKSDEDKAYYGYVLYKSYLANDEVVMCDSFIQNSIDYYTLNKNRKRLAECLYFKAKQRTINQQYEDAINLYLISYDLALETSDYNLQGKCQLDLGNISAIQGEYSKALYEYNQANKCCSFVNDEYFKSLTIISIGRIYRFQKKTSISLSLFRKLLSSSNDSLIRGLLLQELGYVYYHNKVQDSAVSYFRKSLKYPYRGINYCVRCVGYADLLFDLEQLDSSYYYAKKSLKYKGTYFNRRDAYRILTNCEYVKRNMKGVGVYMSYYQNYTDSVRRIEQQTKTTVVEKLYQKSKENEASGKSFFWMMLIFIFLVFLTLSIISILIKRNKKRKAELDIYKKELDSKKVFAKKSITQKIDEARKDQAQKRKNASPNDRVMMDKALYERNLKLDDWETFSYEMNHAFNNIVDVLQTNYTGVNHKEIIWCCLSLLNVPNADKIIILVPTVDSVYKLKQRLAQKMNLKSTKELDGFLNQFLYVEQEKKS